MFAIYLPDQYIFRIGNAVKEANKKRTSMK